MKKSDRQRVYWRLKDREAKTRAWVFARAQYYRRTIRDEHDAEMREVFISGTLAWLEAARNMPSGLDRLAEVERRLKDEA